MAADPPDEITVVLRECENTLRSLAAQGRLTGHALRAFTVLATRVAEEMERRTRRDRRATLRPTPDRRRNTEHAPASGEGVTSPLT